MKYRYIDLFCGAGGLGEGFKQAGFGSAFHVDMDEWAIQTVILREIYHMCEEDKSEFYKILTENSDAPFDPKNLFTENEKGFINIFFKKYSKSSNKIPLKFSKISHYNYRILLNMSRFLSRLSNRLMPTDSAGGFTGDYLGNE